MDKNLSAPLTMQQYPASPQPDQLVLDVRQFAPNPATVASERGTSKVIFGIVGGVAAGALTYYGTRRHFDKGSAGRLAAALSGTALGGIAGSLLAEHIKTGEENRSQVLMDAAHSGNFAANVKKDMERRENNAFLMGALIGFPFYL